jgi:hypothetical protein
VPCLPRVVHGVAKSNLAALSAAFRRWATACVSAQLSESFASESRGDVTVSSAPARILDPSCAPAIVMRRCILLCRQRRLRSAIAVWKRFLSASVAARVATESGFSKAAELYQKSNEELVEKVDVPIVLAVVILLLSVCRIRWKRPRRTSRRPNNK